MIVRRVDKINPAFLLCDMKLGGWTKPQSCGKDLILSYGGGLSPSAKFLLESRSPGVSPSKADKKNLILSYGGGLSPSAALISNNHAAGASPSPTDQKNLVPSHGGGLSPSATLAYNTHMDGASPSPTDKKFLSGRTEGVYVPPQLLFQTIMRLEQAPAVREDLSPSATLSINGHAAGASPSRKD